MHNREYELRVATRVGTARSFENRLAVAMNGVCENLCARRLTCFALNVHTLRHEHFVAFDASSCATEPGLLALGSGVLPAHAADDVTRLLAEAGTVAGLDAARSVTGVRHPHENGAAEHFAWIQMPVDPGRVYCLGAVRPSEQGAFVESEIAELTRATWLLWLAAEANADAEHAALCSAHPMHDVANAVPLGIGIVTREREVVFMNSMLQSILSDADGLVLTGNRVRACREPDDVRLAALVQKASGSEIECGELCMALQRPSARQPYGLLVRRAPAHARQPELLTLHVSAADRGLDLSRNAVRSVLGLTPAESEIAARLADGEDVSAIVRALGIQSATVRVHLRNIYRKTNITRQSELVRLVLRSVASFTHR